MVGDPMELTRLKSDQVDFVSELPNPRNAVSDNSSDNNRLLEIVKNNNIEEIQQMIRLSPMALMNYKYSEYGNKDILTIACIETVVTRETLDCLSFEIMTHHPRASFVNDNWYKWRLLHYAAMIADPEKLRAIINNFQETVNALTTYSENALHVLLKYEKSVNPFNALLLNGADSRECTIINKEKDDMIECVKILIEAQIDVNHSNYWNETPICLAVRYRYEEIIKCLLEVPHIDIDNYKEGNKTIREYLKENDIYQYSLPQFHLNGHPFKLLLHYLKSGEEKLFLDFECGNIKEYVNCIDGDCEDNSSGNMLQICFKKGFLEYYQHHMYSEDLKECDIMDNPMLTIFCTKGLGRCIEHLLDNEADPRVKTSIFSETLLEAAAVRGYYPLVAILLQHKSSRITFEEIYEILAKVFDSIHFTKLKNHANHYSKHVLCLLLDKLISIERNRILNTREINILHNILCKLNLESDNNKPNDSDNIYRILHLGASLTKETEDTKMIIECLHPDILSTHLDNCIDNDKYCYNNIIEDIDDEYSEIKVLSFLVDDKRTKELLCHPLLAHLVHNKWRKVRHFFHINLILHAGLLFSMYAYMISEERRQINVFFYIFVALFISKELFQLYFLHDRKYFSDFSNYLELFVCICFLITISYPNEYTMVISLLVTTVICSIFLGQFPICAKYTIIFGSAKYFLEYASFYLVQFLSFAFVFYVIFPTTTKLVGDSTSNSTIAIDNSTTTTTPQTFVDITGSILNNLFYALIIFTGEFDDRFLESEKYPMFGRIILTVFIFTMTIILNNILVGMIVTDMNNIQEKSKVYKQIKSANFVVRVNFIIKRLLKKYSSNNFIEKVINHFNIFEKGNTKIIETGSDDSNEEKRKYLKDLRSKNFVGYDKDILNKLYIKIQSETGKINKRISD